MSVEIKHRITGEILLCGEYKSVKDCLEKNKKANLRGANLQGADLLEANLRGANLQWANLQGANLQWADLLEADLLGADLLEANLRGANLQWANLQGANLWGANLQGANLLGADLRGANLQGAKTAKRYIQISCIGSRRGITTYCFEDDKIWCGCWQGTLKEFEERVKETHKGNKPHLAEYLGFIEYLKTLKGGERK